MLLEFHLISVIMYNFEQSAGTLWIVSNSKNILVGTSETIRSPHKFL